MRKGQGKDPDPDQWLTDPDADPEDLKDMNPTDPDPEHCFIRAGLRSG